MRDCKPCAIVNVHAFAASIGAAAAKLLSAGPVGDHEAARLQLPGMASAHVMRNLQPRPIYVPIPDIFSNAESRGGGLAEAADADERQEKRVRARPAHVCRHHSPREE